MRPRRRQRIRHVGQAPAPARAAKCPASRAACARSAAPVRARHHHRHHPPAPAAPRTRPGARSAATAGASSRITCALVPLIPNDDTPARRGRPSTGHATASVSSRTLPADQSTCGDGRLRVQRPRQHLVLQRQHHLDHPGHTRRRLRVADIRLQRPQPQRPVLATRPCP